MKLSVWIVLFALPLHGRVLACESDDQCPSGSSCNIELGYCSNPFRSGCIGVMARWKNKATPWDQQGDNMAYFNQRVCNSDDERNGNTNCGQADFDYPEVRIGPSYWDSSQVTAWIYQIILSEVFGIPVTFETSAVDNETKKRTDGTYLSFYDEEPSTSMPYSSTLYGTQDLIEGDAVDGDCLKTDKPCSLMIPEVWDVHTKAEMREGQEKGTILSEYANGIIGNLGFFIPHITVTRYPEFSSYTGLSGDINRVKLAQVFKTPITWKEYCDSYDCSSSDSAATRETENVDEEALYFMEGIYTGFFEANNVTDCETNPECMGHFVAPSCGWSVYAESQLYWNNIGLKSNGPLEPNNGYSYSQMYQVWKAAKATNSDIIMVFYTPDPFVDTLAKSIDYAFHRVSLPPLTEACMTAQINLDRCSDDIDERRGTVFAKCDYAHRPLSKVISRGLQTQSVSSIDGALDSPAFEILSRIKLPDLAIQSIFDEMTEGETTTLSARSATCRWVHDNLQEFTRDFPLGYPRQKIFKEFNDVSYAGFFFGSIAIVVSVTAFALTYYWRDNRTIASAQTDILFSMLIGYTLVSISSLLHAALENNNTLCILKTWTMHVGYCMALIPILVKMSAINKIRRNSRNCKRVKIEENLFKKIITGALGIVVIFIIVWTVVDPPSRVDTYLLIEDDDKAIQNTTVEVYESCSSKSSTWNIIALVVEFLILLSSTVLAFQSRDVMQFVADSHWIGVLVYSHTLFLIASIVNVMTNSSARGSSLAQKITSVIVSIETIVAICVYFVTKFFIIYRQSEDVSENASDLRSGSPFSSDLTKGSTKKEKKEEEKSAVPLIQLDSRRYSVISRKSSNGSKALRRMTVSGVKIPKGGIPNLIKSKAQMEEEIKEIKQTRRSSDVVSEASDCAKPLKRQSVSMVSCDLVSEASDCAKPLKRQSVSMVSFCEDLENDGDVNMESSKNSILKRRNSFGINADILSENDKLRQEVESLRKQLNLSKEEGNEDEMQHLIRGGGDCVLEDNSKEDWLPNTSN